MKQIKTSGIVLRRVDYAEADRIITFLTPDQGKVTAIAKGVRKTKSKLAGGIELFSVSEISYIIGKSEVNTLISTRLEKYYSQIVKDIDRVNLGYKFLKIVNRSTEDKTDSDYFHLLVEAFEALDQSNINLDLIHVWFLAQILSIAGHSPNLFSDQEGRRLQEKTGYDFDFDTMHFFEDAKNPHYSTDHIKFLRLIFSNNKLQAINKVQGCDTFSLVSLPLVQPMLASYVRI
jgi:DNA repair protein RecO (recombination protein O)